MPSKPSAMAEQEGQPLQIKLRLDAGVDAERKFLLATNAAAAQAQVENLTAEYGPAFDKDDVCAGIDCVAGVDSAIAGRWS